MTRRRYTNGLRVCACVWWLLALSARPQACAAADDQTPPPVFPLSVTGERQVQWDYAGLRAIPAVPAVGVHPRVFVGPDEREAICDRLTNSVAGLELFTNYVQRYTTLLRNPRSAYDTLPSAIKLMPDGSARIGNVGFFNDPFVYYTNLVSGATTAIGALIDSGNSVFPRTMAGEMALEALECWVLQDRTGMVQRASNLSVAMDTWATYLLSRPDYNGVSANWMLGGGAAFAEAYDFNAWAMSPAQRADVRKALARILPAPPYYGVGVAPESATSNWAALNTYWLIIMMAMEGETRADVEGHDSDYYATYFADAMGSIYKYLTYGLHPTGELYEGMGKGWFGGARLIAFAKRGFNFFGHSHLRRFVNEAWPACLQPYGYSWTHYDILGGSGGNDERGLKRYQASDAVAMQWVYTNSPAAAFLWRNYVTTAWRPSSTSVWQAFLDFRPFGVSSSYGQELLEAACFVQNASTHSWEAENAAARPSLDWIDTQGATLVARSGVDADAVALQFHVRQDFGGHTFADRGAFALSGLGRIWARFHTGPGSGTSLAIGQESEDNSVVLVDGQAMFVTKQDGDKMRIPAKLAGWAHNAYALFASCDSTYAYSWKWKWSSYPTNGSVTVSSGYQAETNCFNRFRRTGNAIPERAGATPFVAFPHWNSAGYLEGIQRAAYTPLRQAVRTVGLIRGPQPYALIIDDIRKDDASHVYDWQMQIPGDLTLCMTNSLPAGFDPATDVLLRESPATGVRRLLVRMLSPDRWNASVSAPTNDYWRLTVRYEGVQPAYKILLVPLRESDPAPVTAWSGGGALTVTLAGSSDTMAFTPRTVTTDDGRDVTVTDVRVTRDGATLIDYRNVSEPFGYSLPAAATDKGTRVRLQ